MRDSSKPLRIRRRSVLASAAFVPVTVFRSAAQSARTAFTESQRRCIEAFTDRLIPRDEDGPGAVECGVVEYIDRALADFLTGARPAILAGIDAVDAFSRASQGAPLAELPPDKQDSVLRAIETNAAAGFDPSSAAFFAQLRRLTIEGMFCDPSYGGNRNFAGWDLIRYPGPRLAVSSEDQQVGVPIKPVRNSVNGGSHGH
jgi:gluconate 2-dehydrogenase gamma chain